MIVPIPVGTSEVGRSGVVQSREDALSVNEVIAFVARGTVAVFSVSSALIGNRDALSIGIENPVIGAGETDLVVPVPSTAAKLRRLGVV